MTRSSNARIAGLTFLLYIVAGITSLMLFSRATDGEGVAEKLAGIAADPTRVGVLVLLGLMQGFSALVLAVTLFGITRDQDRDVALMGFTCRVAEGIIGGLSVPVILALYGLGAGSAVGVAASDAAHALAGYLLMDTVALPATFFAVGSTCFCWLLLRGRMIPPGLGWLGVIASVILDVALPLRLANFLTGFTTTLVWLPMLVFEVWLAIWFLTKGVAPAHDGALPSHGV